MELYNKINQLLEKKEIKKKQLAMDLGIPYTTLMSAFKRKSTSISLDTVWAIADYLDVTIDYLIRDEITNVNYGKNNTSLFSDTKSFNISSSLTITQEPDKTIIEKFLQLSEKDKYKVEGVIDNYITEEQRAAAIAVGKGA